VGSKGAGQLEAVGAAGRGEETRRRWPRRLLIGLNVFVAICLISAGATYAYVSYRFGQITRVTVQGLSAAAPTAGPVGSAGPPMNILVVGSDTRFGLTDGAEFGGSNVSGARSDTIMLVHLDPDAGTASLLSIPRDLWVSIPGVGEQRINAAFNNGPDLLVRTIQDDLGIPINHYVDLDFDSFQQVVNALGGIKFWYPEPVRDNDNGVNDSGLNITTPGCYDLDGSQALSLVRTRHMQYEHDGEWIFEAESDLARIRRQQLFVRKIIAKAEALGLTNIDSVAKLNGVLGGVVDNLTVDSGFSQAEMVALGRRYKDFNPAALPSATLPTTGTVIDGNDVLLLQQAAAQQIIALWEGAQTPASTSPAPVGPPPSPSAITVGVLNGSGISGQATAATQALRTAGFGASISGYGNASSFGYQTSVVEYGTGGQSAAHLLQTEVVGGSQTQVDSSLSANQLILITGSSYAGINPAAAAAAAAAGAPTTVAPASAGSAGSAGSVLAGAAATASALDAIPGNSSNAPPFPGPDGQDPPPPGSGC